MSVGGGGGGRRKNAQESCHRSTKPHKAKRKVHKIIMMPCKIEDESQRSQTVLLDAVGKLFFSNGHRQGDTPLHAAAYHGHMEVARLLIAARAQLDATDDDNGQGPQNLQQSLYGTVATLSDLSHSITVNVLILHTAYAYLLFFWSCRVLLFEVI